MYSNHLPLSIAGGTRFERKPALRIHSRPFSVVLALSCFMLIAAANSARSRRRRPRPYEKQDEQCARHDEHDPRSRPLDGVFHPTARG